METHLTATHRTANRKHVAEKRKHNSLTNAKLSILNGISGRTETKKKDAIQNDILHIAIKINLLYLINDSLESLRVVNSEVSKHLTVDFNSSLVQSTHQC